VTVFCASVAYPVGSERFDEEYFATRHVPMFAALLGDNCIRWEVHRPVRSPGAPEPTFRAAAYFWIRSAERFGRTLAEHANAIYADVANVSDAVPARAWTEVLPATGPPGRPVISTGGPA
jgi:uncharacterized protein (TIGR02118 family)